jgi:nitrite reductase/ring-hydroxylating ferredoxin subunit
MAEAGEASIGCAMPQDVMDSLSGPNGDHTHERHTGDVIARLDALPQCVPVEYEARVTDAQTGIASHESLIVYRDGDQVRAWLNICPHAGRRLDWAPGKFLTTKDGQLVCAAHGATFELRNGECVAGPCRGDGLRAVKVEVVEGEVLADISYSSF